MARVKELADKFRSYIKTHQKLSLAISIGTLLFIFIISLLSNSAASPTNSPQSSNNAIGNTNTSIATSNAPSLIPSTIYFAQKIENSLTAAPTIQLFTATSLGTNVTLVGKLNTLAKQIVPLSPSTYLYIGDLGFLDRGKNIYSFDTKTNLSKGVISASVDFQIDSYLLSPTKDAVVFWEVTTGATNTGESHIVYQNLAEISSRKILLSEPLSDQTKYPVYWSNSNNTIYLNTYSVNRLGKDRGMFTLTLKGTVAPLPNLGLNQYSADPIFSPDGRFIAYTSYNSATKIKLPAPPVPNQIFREQVRNPNQLKVMDLGSNSTPILLTEALDGTIFDNLLFSADNQAIIYRTLSIAPDHSTTPKEYRIIGTDPNPATQTNNPFSDNPNGLFISQFSGGITLMGLRSDITDDLGGTVGPYSQIITSTYLYDPNLKTYKKILTDDNIQIIGVE